MKIFRGLLALAATTATLSMTSCMNNDLPAIEFNQNSGNDNTEVVNVKIGEIKLSKTYKYTVKSSTDVKLFIDDALVNTGSLYNKGEKTMGSEIKIKAIAINDGYSKQEIVKTVKLDANGKVIYLDIPKLASKSSTIAASDAKAKASTDGSVTIENSSSNKSLSYKASTTADLVLSNTAISRVADDKTLAIDVENASTNTIRQEICENAEEDFDVMVVRSASKDVKLGENATVTINNSNFEKGMIFKTSAKNEEKVVENDATISFDINELKDYTISCHAVITLDDVTDDDTPAKGFFDVPVGGTKTITYYTKSGYTCVYQTNEFITKYLDAKFGAYTEQGKQVVTIENNDQHANVPYTINQKLYHYTVSFGSTSVKITVYGADDLVIDAEKAEKYKVTKTY